jgi:hypothetical protein
MLAAACSCATMSTERRTEEGSHTTCRLSVKSILWVMRPAFSAVVSALQSSGVFVVCSLTLPVNEKDSWASGV